MTHFPGADVLYTAVGAVLVMASLFGFGILAERMFVTRREFDMLRATINERFANLEVRVGELSHILDARLSQIVDRLPSPPRGA